MTAINPLSPTRRETGTFYRGRALLVELHPGYLTLRQKGKRHKIAVDYGAIMDLGYKILAREAAAEKAEKKKNKKG